MNNDKDPVEQAHGSPHIVEALSWHANERDDLTLDDAVDVIRHGWKKVHGRSERQLVLQIASLLASPPPSPQADKEVVAKLEAAIERIRSTPHDDNCFLHNDGGEFDRCFCGKDGLLNWLESDTAEPANKLQEFYGLSQEIGIDELMPAKEQGQDIAIDRKCNICGAPVSLSESTRTLPLCDTHFNEFRDWKLKESSNGK